MNRRLRNAASASGTDTEWSDAEERATHRALLFKKKIDQGAAACARGDFVAALTLYEDAIRLDPTNHVLYTNRSAIYCKLGRFEEALADAEKSFALNPSWIKAFYRKGYALKSMGRNVTALSAYASGLAQDSKNVQVLGGLIECILQSDMKDRFMDVYNELKYLGLDKSPFVIVSVVGQEVLNCGHVADAINILECALRIGTTSLKLRQSVLSALSTAYYNIGDWTKASQLMEEDLSIAVSLGDLSGEARAQGNLGMLALACAKLTDALAHYQRQFKLLMQLNAKFQSATALSTIGQIYRRSFNYQQALSNHQQCSDILQELNTVNDQDYAFITLLCQQYGYIGDLHLALGQFEEAEKYFNDHLDNSRCHDLKAEEIKALSELGALDQACGRWDDALKNYSAALNVAKEERNRAAESSLCCSLSTVYESRGRLETARKWVDRALALALSLKDAYVEAKACGHLATVELKMGALENAKKLFRRQLDMAAKLGDTALIMKSYRGLGVCYSTTEASGGCLTDAIRCHKTELSLAQDSGDKFSEATAHGHLGTVYAKLSDFKSAESHFQTQLKLAKETRSTRLEMTATRNLAFHYSADSEENSNFESSAMEYFEKYLMLAQETNDLDAEHTACTNLGKTHFRLGRYKEASRYYDQALSLAKDLRDHRAMAKAYCDLGKIRAAMNEFEEALECQKYFLALSHILNDTDSKLAALSNIGEVLLKSRKPTVAAKVLAKQLALAKAGRRKKFEAIAYGQLGRTYHAAGKTGKALALFLQELALYEDLNDVDGQYEAHGHISEHYKLEGQIASALKALEKQAQLAKQYGRQQKEADVYKRMGELCAQNNQTDDALEYFNERRRILELKSIKSNPGDNNNDPKQEASLDYVRCLLTTGDDLGAVKAMDELMQFLENDDAANPEIGLMYRDQGWCWFRLRNYRKAMEAFESALDYFDRSVVDASVKSDCYRALAAIELALGHRESAMAQLNRRLEFIKSIGFSMEEPKALCDLAYVHYWNGETTRAESLLQNALLKLRGNSKGDPTEFRAMLVLAMIKNDFWDDLAYMARDQKSDLAAVVVAARAITQLPTSADDAGRSIAQGLDVVTPETDVRIVVILRTLSGLCNWTMRNIQASRDEFLRAVHQLDNFESCQSRNSNGGDPALFDEELLASSSDICYILSLAFFASQKMDEDALVVAEKLRMIRIQRCLRASGVRPCEFNMDFDSMALKLKSKLNDLDKGIVYFAQMEDVLFSWILTSGFRISSATQIVTGGTDQGHEFPTPIQASMQLQFPLFPPILIDHIKKLIIRDCFNGSVPAAIPASTVLNRTIETALAHENQPPIIVGCNLAIGWSSEFKSTIFRLSLIPFESKANGNASTTDGLIISAVAENHRQWEKCEILDPRSTSKAAILSKFGQCAWVNVNLKYSASDQALILYGNYDQDDYENLLTIADILNASVAANVVIISSDADPGELSNIGAAFLISGAVSVVLVKETSDPFLDRFYGAMKDGASASEALDVASRGETKVVIMEKDSEKRSKNSDASAAMRMLLQTPEESREALRVALHLIEKALQRINSGVSNPMFTSEQSVRNKAGPEVRGCVEYLLSLGFQRGDTRGGRVSAQDALYFPINDGDGKLAGGSAVVQALLGLPVTALFAFSKLISCAEVGIRCLDVLNLVEKLARDLAISSSISMEAMVSTSLWSVAGLPELLAALGFDKMRESDGGVVVKTIRMELTKKKVAAAVVSMKAIFGDLVAQQPSHPIQHPTPTASNGSTAKIPLSKLHKSYDSTADLSGLESDFSTMDTRLKSMVSLVKRCRNNSTGAGSGIAKKRGKRTLKPNGKLGGYVSEGDEMRRAKLEPAQRSRGYCSEDDDRRRMNEELETSTTAQVISVDERCSPVFSDEDAGRFPEENVVVVTGNHQHEYARLETPIPMTVFTYGNGHDHDSNGYAAPRNQPPPYQVVFPIGTSSVGSSYQDLCGPPAMRKAMERMAAHQQSGPPSYGHAVQRQNQGSPPARMPPPYGMHNKAIKPNYGSPRNLAGY